MEKFFLLPFIEVTKNGLSIRKRVDMVPGTYALQDIQLPDASMHFGRPGVTNNIWMTNDWFGVGELLSQLIHARGRCLCTGLGLGLLPLLLVANSKVTEIVVLEKQKEVIDFFEQQGFLKSNKLKIINTDCLDYKDQISFDCLLLDHANELEAILPGIDNIKKNTCSEKSICIPYLWQHTDDIELFRSINLPIEIWQYRPIYAFHSEDIIKSFYGKAWQLPKIKWSIPFISTDKEFYNSQDEIKLEISKILKLIHRYRNSEILKTLEQQT